MNCLPDDLWAAGRRHITKVPHEHSIRPRIQCDEDGALDDFMARDVAMVHFEALDDAEWYATVTLTNGDIWQLTFGAINSRAKGYARAEQAK